MSLPLYPAHSDLTANLSQNTTSEPTGVGVQRSILAPVLFLEMAVGVSGNILVIVTKIKNSKLVRSNFGILMFNLSVSDLGCSLVIMVSALVSVLAGSWVLGAVVCDLVCLLNYTFIIVSMGTLGAISLDRFVAVVFAVRYRTLFPRGVAVLACVSTWIFGLVFGSVPVILRWVSYDGSELVCTIRWNEDFCCVVIYTLCAFAVCFLTPIVIIASSYSLMYRAYRRAASKSNRKNSSSPRLAEMIIVLVLSYLFCYSPFAVTKVLKVAKQDLRAVPDWLSMLASLMAFLNCGMNPLIYLTNPGFREVVLKMCWTNGRREIHSVCKTVSKEQRPA